MHHYTRMDLIEAGYQFIGVTTNGADIFVLRNDQREYFQPQREHFRFMRVGGVTNDNDVQKANDWAMPDARDASRSFREGDGPQQYTISWGSMGFEGDVKNEYAFEYADTLRIIAEFLNRVNEQNTREYEECHKEWKARNEEWVTAAKQQAEVDTFIEMRNMLRLNDHYLDTDIFVLDRIAIELDGFSPAVFNLYEVTGTNTARRKNRINGTSAIGVGDARKFLKEGDLGGLLVRPSGISRVRAAVTA